MGTIGPTEWFWILLIAVLLFGAKKLPELGRSLGQSLKEFKRASRELIEEEEKSSSESSSSS